MAPTSKKPPSIKPPAAFTFIDLFAGIGGIRLGFQSAGGQCVFTSEWNRFSQRTYQANFSDEHPITGDITQIKTQDIPEHDVLVAGFPCQPFSIAGVSKKASMGRAHGFKDKTQGTLFFDVARIIKDKRPKAFLLENVKNLLSHDKGNTFKVICETLVQELGYTISYKVIDGRHFTPQHRERIYIIGWRSDVGFNIHDIPFPKPSKTMKDILHPQDGKESPCAYTSPPLGKVLPKYTLTPKLWTYLQQYAAKHKAAGNGFGFGLVGPNNSSRTLSARYYKDGSEILVDQGPNTIPRRLTPRECARLMGFDDTFQIVVSDTQAYKQFGNSVVVPVICTLAQHMLPFLNKVPPDSKPSKKTSPTTSPPKSPLKS